MSLKKFNSLFISHGAPNLILDNTDKTKGFLKGLSKNLHNGSKPKAVLIISAHWEENDFTIQTTENPDVIYDFYGFEDEMYKLKYPTKTSPELIDRVTELFAKSKIPLKKDNKRGYDHGAWVSLKLIYPDADVPVVQLSLKANLNAKEHYNVGTILRPLRDEGYLVLSSGGSVHNLRAIFDPKYQVDPSWASNFENWLFNTITKKTGKERENELLKYESLPYTRLAHPRTEHLLPLFVAAGCASDISTGKRVHDFWKTPVFSVSSYLFEDKDDNKL
ncbi:hypothetical protein DICPUDRAFT_94334 [Dictyostelium purpureum]|uniref:Extradiol ring-cleavage dioxygenase class III enzyme subunit B domain-containing protein n=1 Tax=Dictyostelium purpureum TaxID=5786 RepID=F0ZI97_DICPU|nr:uncharacterized protein DICPUDRAFT_94334 [Dictyostelium purpureum]EGC36319.1 hypothetical protein DICPUDRAFT_94334 [Dictyostelium purpureum]|eukprot:XP_003287134.1 hypothetical protein DICPUDRAFT_94334 [Dictyostelium purpureum]